MPTQRPESPALDESAETFVPDAELDAIMAFLAERKRKGQAESGDGSDSAESGPFESKGGSTSGAKRSNPKANSLKTAYLEAEAKAKTQASIASDTTLIENAINDIKAGMTQQSLLKALSFMARVEFNIMIIKSKIETAHSLYGADITRRMIENLLSYGANIGPAFSRAGLGLVLNEPLVLAAKNALGVRSSAGGDMGALTIPRIQQVFPELAMNARMESKRSSAAVDVNWIDLVRDGINAGVIKKREDTKANWTTVEQKLITTVPVWFACSESPLFWEDSKVFPESMKLMWLLWSARHHIKVNKWTAAMVATPPPASEKKSFKPMSGLRKMPSRFMIGDENTAGVLATVSTMKPLIADYEFAASGMILGASYSLVAKQ